MKQEEKAAKSKKTVSVQEQQEKFGIYSVQGEGNKGMG